MGKKRERDSDIEGEERKSKRLCRESREQLGKSVTRYGWMDAGPNARLSMQCRWIRYYFLSKQAVKTLAVWEIAEESEIKGGKQKCRGYGVLLSPIKICARIVRSESEIGPPINSSSNNVKFIFLGF